MVIHDHVTDLLPAYALDCLDEEECIIVSEHLAICEQCCAELHSFQAVADQLALAAPEAAPSARLKDRIMTRLRPKMRSARDENPRLTWWQRLVTPIHRTAPAWGLASLLLVVVLGVSTWMLWQQINRMKTLYQAKEFQVVRLSCTHAAPSATGQIMISKNGRFGILIVVGLPVLDPAYRYQLWLIQDGQRTNGGMFSVTQNGYGSMNIIPPQSLSDCSSFSITIEPVQGSPGPTGEKVLEAIL